MDTEAAINKIISYIRWHNRPPIQGGAGDADWVPLQRGDTYGRWRDTYLNWLFAYRDTVSRYQTSWSEGEVSRVFNAYDQNPLFAGAPGGARKAQRVWYELPLDVRGALTNGAMAGRVQLDLDRYINSELRFRFGNGWLGLSGAQDWLQAHGGSVDVTNLNPRWWIVVQNR